MAITKFIGPIHPPKNCKSGGRYMCLKNAINYVLNGKKTEEGILTGGHNCSTATALKEMILTKEQYGKTSTAPSERMGYHYVVSWKKDTVVDKEKALQILKEFCEEHLKGFEAVYSVHTDKDHCHGHIVFNSVNMENGYKYRYEANDWAKKIQPIIDKLCQKYGLKTLEQDTGKTLKEYDKEIRGRKKKSSHSRRKWNPDSDNSHSNNKYYNEGKEAYSKMDYVRQAVDTAIQASKNFEEWLEQMRIMGFEIKQGKHLAVKGKGMDRFRRLRALGDEYTEESIKRRIGQEFPDSKDTFLEKDSVCCIPKRYWIRSIQIRGRISPIKKKQVVFIYKQVTCKKYQYPSYYQIRNIQLRELQKSVRKLSLLNQYPSKREMDDAAEKQKELCNSLQKELKQAYQERRALRIQLEQQEFSSPEEEEKATQKLEEINQNITDLKEQKKEEMSTYTAMEELKNEIAAETERQRTEEVQTENRRRQRKNQR